MGLTVRAISSSASKTSSFSGDLTSESELSVTSASDTGDVKIDLPGTVCISTAVSGVEFCIDFFALLTGGLSEGGDFAAIEIGRRDCGEDDQTPLLVSANIPFFEVSGPDDTIQESTDLWVGVTLRGQPEIWVGESTSNACVRVGSGEAVEAVAEATDAEEELSEAEEIADVLIEEFKELTSDVPDWIWVPVAFFLLVVIAFVIFAAVAEPTPAGEAGLIAIGSFIVSILTAGS